ncbi:MAG TPA: hypothetical protein VFQ61_01535 [Polyangiaceae bacterium]|nr:hypothetical protein [Polyangiaceae bacterium]
MSSFHRGMYGIAMLVIGCSQSSTLGNGAPSQGGEAEDVNTPSITELDAYSKLELALSGKPHSTPPHAGHDAHGAHEGHGAHGNGHNDGHDCEGTDAHGAEQPEPIRDAAAETAQRLIALAADSIGDNAHNGLPDFDPGDGGWDFVLSSSATSHSERASPENTYGATALGLWSAPAPVRTQPRSVAALVDAYLGASRRAEVDSSPDLVWLVSMADEHQNPGYAELARQRYDAARDRLGGVEAVARDLVQRRVRANADGLVTYDLAWLGLGAAALSRAFPSADYANDVATVTRICAEALALTGTEPAAFDLEDRSEPYYVQGVAGALLALSLDPATRNFTPQVRRILFDEQLSDGGFGFNSAYPTANLQASAQVILALVLADPTPRAIRRAQRAARWVVSRHRAGGGFEAQAGLESPLLDAEILLALRVAYAGPRDDSRELGSVTDADDVTPVDTVVASSQSALRVLGDQPSLGSPALLAAQSSVTRR